MVRGLGEPGRPHHGANHTVVTTCEKPQWADGLQGLQIKKKCRLFNVSVYPLVVKNKMGGLTAYVSEQLAESHG